MMRRDTPVSNLSVAGITRSVERALGSSPAHWQPREQHSRRARKVGGGATACVTQGLGLSRTLRVRGSHEPFPGHPSVGGAIGRIMAHALRVTDHGHASFLWDVARFPALAAARTITSIVVQILASTVTDRGPVGRRTRVNGSARRPAPSTLHPKHVFVMAALNGVLSGRRQYPGMLYASNITPRAWP